MEGLSGGEAVAIGVDAVAFTLECEGDVVANILLVLDHRDAFAHASSVADHSGQRNHTLGKRLAAWATPANSERLAASETQVPLFALFARKGFLNLGATNSNNAKGGTPLITPPSPPI